MHNYNRDSIAAGVEDYLADHIEDYNVGAIVDGLCEYALKHQYKYFNSIDDFDYDEFIGIVVAGLTV